MKRVILTLGLIIASNCNAQLIVKESAKDTVVWQASKMATVPKLVKFTLQNRESYTIYYRNAKYTQINDVDYISIGDLETTIQFFEVCKSVAETGKEFSVEIGSKSLLISKGTLGTVLIWSESSYFYLSGKQVNSILDSLK